MKVVPFFLHWRVEVNSYIPGPIDIWAVKFKVIFKSDGWFGEDESTTYLVPLVVKSALAPSFTIDGKWRGLPLPTL